MKTWRALGGGLHVSMCVCERERECVCVCVCSFPFSLLSEWFHLGNKLSSQICRCLQIVFCPEGKKIAYYDSFEINLLECQKGVFITVRD